MNIFQSVTKVVTNAGGAIAGAASQTGEAVFHKSVDIGGAIGDVASLAGQAVIGTTVGVSGTVSGAVIQASQTVVGTTASVSEAISDAASRTGQAVMGTTVAAGGAIGSAASLAGQAVMGTATGVGGTIASVTSQTGKAVAGKALATASATVQASQAAIEIVAKTASESMACSMSLMFRDCTVPAFLLPTGSDPRNFKCTFCFDEAISELTSGTLVRPQVQVWAGCADVDRAHLAQILKRDFIDQFNAAREQSREANQNAYADRIASLKSKQEQNGQEAGKSLQIAASFAGTALLLMFFAASSIFSLIFFSLAIFGGVDGIAKILNYLRLSFQVSGDEDKLKREQQKLEADFDSKNEAFTQAVKNMTIHVHPVLHEAITLFSELDNTFLPPINPEPLIVEIPSVHELFDRSDYREELPVEYLPLLDLLQKG